ncbi:MAG TPA: DUF1538 domain-containing protein [Tissierellia bacterium]|nr:DUF1538 domain-containing protein [Tissierellia bacterium]
MRLILDKFKEVFFSLAPITLIVVILHFTITPLSPLLLGRFLMGALLILIGLTIFLFGIDIGLYPVGEYIGVQLTETRKISLFVIISAFIGFFISVAEPDLHILARQASDVTAGMLGKNIMVLAVSVGLGFIVSLGLYRIVKSFPLKKFFLISYLVILFLAIFTSKEFIALSFDASGATTGAMTVPFLLALSKSVSTQKGDDLESQADSFGLVGIASSGAIMAVMMLYILSGRPDLSGKLPKAVVSADFWSPFLASLVQSLVEIALAIGPILLIFLLFYWRRRGLSKYQIGRIAKGSIYIYLGLITFMTGVNGGFLDISRMLGQRISEYPPYYAIGLAFLLGLFTVLAEPAVIVLSHQIEDVTGGSVSRPALLVFLSVGVGLSLALSIVRIQTPWLHLWHFLLPGYIISIFIMRFVPDLFVGIAFDSGGVASGPMAATFILAFSQGVANGVPTADVLIDGFGIIAMVAMAPVIALQLLGLLYRKDVRGK